MHSSSMTRQAFDHFKKMRKASLPGNYFALKTMPFLLLPVFFLFVFAAVLTHKPQHKDPHPLAVLCFLFVGLVVFVAAVVILVIRDKQNRQFVKDNSLYLDYDSSARKYSLYSKFIRRLSEANYSGITRISARDRSDEYVRVPSDVRFREDFIEYLDANVRIYSLTVGFVRYYFLPDCVLVFDGDFSPLSWARVHVSANSLIGDFKTQEYREVMVHGRIRSDGRYDQRFNTKFQNRLTWVWHSLDQYGTMSFAFGRSNFVLMVPESDVARRVESSFMEWKMVT